VDEDIAKAIEKHLRQNFSYTLDLTDTRRVEGHDPMVSFLYDFKRGHCEYFAGAMTLMCQGLGLDARMVVGFRCDEFNTFGSYYTVRQSQAHAWVEVRTKDHGWMMFDPTSGRELQVTTASVWQKTMSLVDFLQYKWANSVIAYGNENRDTLLNQVDQKITNTAIGSAASLSGLKGVIDLIANWLANKILGPLIGLMLLVVVGLIAWFIVERWRLRRRASRIGLETLPSVDMTRLVKQLAFYDQLVLLLEKQSIFRPRHMTPLEFSDSLAYLPAQTYRTIHRLTDLFYRIRFGGSELDAGQLRRLENAVERLARSMRGEVL